jgi:hypothetical protein
MKSKLQVKFFETAINWSDDKDEEVQRKTSLTSYSHFLSFRWSHETQESD